MVKEQVSRRKIGSHGEVRWEEVDSTQCHMCQVQESSMYLRSQRLGAYNGTVVTICHYFSFHLASLTIHLTLAYVRVEIN